MNRREVLGNVSVAFLAQGIALGVSVIQTLLVPKTLGVEQYGYWQLFIFYGGYAGFFPLGLVDGVYLINGGKTRGTIDKASVYSQWRVGLIYEVVLALAIVAVGLFGGFEPNRALVIAGFGVYVLISNSVGYMQFVLEAMNEVKRSSIGLIIERVFYFLPLAVLMIAGVTSFVPYMVAYLFSSVMQLAYLLWHFRDFLRAPFLGWKTSVVQTVASMRVGIALMIANIVSALILGVARFAIDAEWGIKTFGLLSLSFTLMSFFVRFVNQVGMVLFPALRQSTREEVKVFHRYSRDAMSLFLPVAYLMYFPLSAFIAWWLPAYRESLQYVLLLMPICVFESKMNISGLTFFKVFRRERMLLAVNVGSVVVSAAGVLAGMLVFHNVDVVVCAAVFAIMLRSLVSEQLVNRQLGTRAGHLSAVEVVLTLIFLVTAKTLAPLVAMGVYALAYATYLVTEHRTVKEVLNKAVRR